VKSADFISDKIRSLRLCGEKLIGFSLCLCGEKNRVDRQKTVYNLNFHQFEKPPLSQTY